MFPSQGYLNKHTKESHENPASFQCEICSRNFNNKGNLLKHKRIHDKNRPKPFKCHQCDYATDKIYGYKIHQKYHETQKGENGAVKCEKMLEILQK
jgi:KRAB domain-containing zinc finger protein